MKLGVLTACLPQLELDVIADWAARHGYEALEVAVWPSVGGRPFEASHLDVTALDADSANGVVTGLADRGLQISALAYYENNLHPDEARRSGIHDHLRHCIDAAVLLGCPYVGTFVGRDAGRSVKDNLAFGETELPPLVAYAEERGVHLIIENCPMEGWHPDGYPCNLAYSPELWEWMFSVGFYLNYDPSHLTFLGIDPIAAIEMAGDRILHAQAKDVQMLPGGINRFGAFGQTVGRSDPWDNGCYRYRVPGRGDVNWNAVVDALYQIGFDGTLSVEHEDPIWSGDEDRIFSGLEIAQETLRPLVRSSAAGGDQRTHP